MKRMMPLVLATLTLGATLLAESPTWAEQLHKTKTGQWPAGVEKRLQEEKVAREKARQQQVVAEAIAKLDTNGDGAVSKAERESVSKKQ
jgi:hypothetical protein